MEPDWPVLVEYGSGGQVALITLNRPAPTPITTTEMGAADRDPGDDGIHAAVRVAIVAGAGDRAFSVAATCASART